MVKKGGISWNGSPGGKTGVNTKFKCSNCGRQYKINYMKDRHERLCYENGGK